jgi:dihydroorotate dehydrogenase (fumarate)
VPWTSVVTARTSLINGVDLSPAKHQYAFYDVAQAWLNPRHKPRPPGNSLRDSPFNLETDLGFITAILDELPIRPSKGFIVSVTGTPEDIAICYAHIVSAAPEFKFLSPWRSALAVLIFPANRLRPTSKEHSRLTSPPSSKPSR